MKKTLLALIVSSLLAPAAFAGADVALPKELPPYAQDKPLPVPQIAKRTLSNGMTVWVLPREGLPRVDYVLAFRGAGLAADGAGQQGFATLLASLMNEGTATLDSRQIAETAQGMGGSVGAAAGFDGVTLYSDALASHAGPMMRLLADVARHPAFAVNEVELAKKNALQSLKVSEAQPGFRAERALAASLYGDHPYARTQPTQASIGAISSDSLKAAHAQRFRPDRALLVVTGRISEAEAFKLAEAAFGDWKASGAALPDTAASIRSTPVTKQLLERKGSVQSTIRLGRPAIAATEADYVPLKLTGTILGGGFSSRVNQNLRENKGYTYGASASSRTYRNGGSIVGGADVRNDVTGAALKEFFGEYSRIGTDLVPAAELDMNKRYVAGGYLINNQLQASVAGTLAGNWLLGLPAEFLGQYVPMIQKVNAEQVREMGKKYFSPESQSIVVVGDPAAVADKLKEYGEFELKAQ